MLVSVFTPTHDPKHLGDAFASLTGQSGEADWEWVLVPNRGATLPAEVTTHPRVKVFPYPFATDPGIGALKKFACGRCAGGLFVELDHDDYLAPDALGRLAVAQAATPGGFYYSDFVNFTADGASSPCGPELDRWVASGWQHYDFLHAGKVYRAMRAWEPSPSSLRQVYWAPNHVRAWDRDAYKKVFGHRDALAVCDDLDLIHRTYLAGVPFVHVPAPLYFYREHANTYRSKAEEIAAASNRLAAGATVHLIHEWCRRSGLKKVDLGPPRDVPHGYTAVNDSAAADVACDVEHGLPFAESSVGVVRAYDFLQHVRRERVVSVMNDVYRVLAPGGWLLTNTPSTDGRGAFCDPTHASYWNLLSWRYYADASYRRHCPGIEARFQQIDLFDTRADADGIVWTRSDLVALKGQRPTGPVSV